ncbi:MAG: imidazole glycerol phosphate synthase subunit HisH [Bacteroidaceae bacterium]|nr:imidazole glycerol phosphate synthase subunit HisH [Bacteroidaceae bacterium]
MKVAIIDYNAGNIRSVENALRRLGVEPLLTADHDIIRRADKVVFPGQGEASSTMGFLREKGLDEVIRNLRQPTLGICIGMQLMCRHSEEGDTDCLGIFDVDVKRFQNQRHEDKIPQMGWNTIMNTKGALYEGFIKEEYVYFVHSYYVPLCPWTAAETDYIQPYSASICKDNFFATQFHPEKSGKVGERILQNFLNL